MKTICVAASTVMVDDQNHGWVSAITDWVVLSKKGYVARRTDQGWVYLHNLIAEAAGFPPSDTVDHKDRNPLNNQVLNLRPASFSQNQINQGLRSDNSSGYKGVTWVKKACKWRAAIMRDRKRICLGCFEDKHEAARMYNAAAIQLFGDYAYLNKIKEEDETETNRSQFS